MCKGELPIPPFLDIKLHAQGNEHSLAHFLLLIKNTRLNKNLVQFLKFLRFLFSDTRNYRVIMKF